MQIIHVTVMSLCLLWLSVAAVWAAPEFQLKSEYRHDALDYGSETSWFFRQKMRYSSGNTLAGAAVTRKSEPEQYSATGCAVFSPILQHSRVTAGNFYTSFGAGLLIGKANSFNPDPFTSRPLANPEKTFTPCLSGNPEYAFRGLGISMSTPGQTPVIDMNAFYSMQERYTTAQQLNNGATSQSINSLLTRTRKEAGYDQPVNMHTGGISIGFRPAAHLLLQANYYTSKLVYDGDKTLEWNSHEDEFHSSSVHMLRGTGYYAVYRDDFVTAFVEQCWTFNRTTLDGERRSPGVSGMVAGARYRGPFMESHLTYKKTHPEFMAPFGNALGSGNPEEVLSLRVELKPVSAFQVGITLEDENRLAPSTYYGEYPHARKRSVFCGLDLHHLSISADIAQCRVYRKGQVEYYTRHKLQYALFSGERLSLDGKTWFQSRRYSGYSWLTAGHITYSRWMNFRVETGLLWFSAQRSNPLHATLLQLPRTSIPFMYIAGRSMLGACRLKYSRGNLGSWARVLYPLYRENARMKKILEFALTMEF